MYILEQNLPKHQPLDHKNNQSYFEDQEEKILNSVTNINQIKQIEAIDDKKAIVWINEILYESRKQAEELQKKIKPNNNLPASQKKQELVKYLNELNSHNEKTETKKYNQLQTIIKNIESQVSQVKKQEELARKQKNYKRITPLNKMTYNDIILNAFGYLSSTELKHINEAIDALNTIEQLSQTSIETKRKEEIKHIIDNVTKRIDSIEDSREVKAIRVAQEENRIIDNVLNDTVELQTESIHLQELETIYINAIKEEFEKKKTIEQRISESLQDQAQLDKKKTLLKQKKAKQQEDLEKKHTQEKQYLRSVNSSIKKLTELITSTVKSEYTTNKSIEQRVLLATNKLSETTKEHITHYSLDELKNAKYLNLRTIHVETSNIMDRSFYFENPEDLKCIRTQLQTDITLVTPLTKESRTRFQNAYNQKGKTASSQLQKRHIKQEN